MKKLLFLMTLAVIMLVFAGCGHEHTFGKATCLEPQTCTECGATNGTALGHAWKDATCQAPKTCERCSETQGEKVDHDVTEGKCSMCGLDYYEELVSLLKKYGDYSEYTANQKTYGSYAFGKVDVGVYDDVYISFRLHNNTCSIGTNNFESRGAYTYDFFTLTLDKHSVARKQYNWDFDANAIFKDSYGIAGQLYAPDYSPSAEALIYNNSTFNTSYKAGEAANDAKEALDIGLELFSELLAKSEHHLTPAHYGFDYYK